MIPQTKSSALGQHTDKGASAAVWLVDNGSLRAESILALREQAALLAQAAGVPVEAISVLHSDKVPADSLGGIGAEVFTSALRRRAAQGLRHLRVVPYFFGPSAALTEYLPFQAARVCAEYPDLQVEMTPPLVRLQGAGDMALELLAVQLAQSIREAAAAYHFSTAEGEGSRLPAAVLVDHGSPQAAVSAVRDAVGARLRSLLGQEVSAFAVASMEAREGEKYAHTLPLLKDVLGSVPFCEGRVIIAPLFLGPGRHAGPQGDLEQIAAEARAEHPQLRTRFCPLLGGTAAVTQILLERLRGDAAILPRSPSTGE